MENPYATNGLESSPHPVDLEGCDISRDVRGMQIIAFALMMGVLIFMGITLVITQAQFNGPVEIMTMIGLGFAGLMAVNHVVIPKIIVATQLNQFRATTSSETASDQKVKRLIGIYRTGLILAMAMLEGAAFFNLIALMLDRSPASLAVVAVLIFMMAFQFPMTTRVTWWIHNELRELNQS